MKASFPRLYDFLVNEDDARACRDIPEDSCTDVPSNFLKILFAQWLTKIADSLSSAKIVLPWLLAELAAPAFFIGILVPIRESGSLLPQLLIGGVIRRFPKRKFFFSFGSIAQALCVLLMVWVGFTFKGVIAGIAITVLLILFSLARGVCSVASKDVLGKTVPKTRRGLLNGYSASAAGLVTLALGVVMVTPLGQSSSITLLYLMIASGCWCIAACFYGLVDETEGATSGGGNAIKEAFANINLLKTDKTFRNFVLVRSLMMSSGLAAPFFVVLANSASVNKGTATTLGLFLITNGLANLLSGVIWGRLADTSSRTVMILTALLTAVLCVIASVTNELTTSPPMTGMLSLYFLLAVTHQGVRLGRKTYIVDLAQGNRRTDYVSVSNTVIGFLLLFFGMVAALIAQLSLSLVLLLLAVSAIAAVLFGRSLPEVSK